MELTAENVTKALGACTSYDTNDKNYKEVEGVVHTYGLDMFWVEEHKEDIKSMLLQLDDKFMNDGGGGWSFLNMPMRADGVQWGEQMNAEQLLVLGMACDLVSYLMPREMWSMFAGGMPYVQVMRKEKEDEEV